VGERWRLTAVDLPKAWLGKPIVLVAKDAAGPGEWFGVSEPVGGGGDAQLTASLAAFALNGLFFGGMWLAVVRRLSGRSIVPEHWVPLAGAAAVAVAGYLCFWAFFARPVLGQCLSGGLLILAFADAFRGEGESEGIAPEVLSVAAMALLIGLFYVALLNLFPSNLSYNELASNRWQNLPGDNYLPQQFASDAYRGETLRWPQDGWLSSDRPPLQSCWMLLTWAPLALLRLDDLTAGGTAALWFQLLWVFAAYALMRDLGLSRGAACKWTAAFALCGFFILNSVFTWPKLSAAAFCLGSFALWVFPRKGPEARYAVQVGGMMAALALLSHGGAAFSLIAMVPWLVTRLRGRCVSWAVAVGLFLVLMLPWMAFQKFYAPPANRLLKWHLAGQIDIDSRGTWQTLKDSYSGKSLRELMDVRVSNLETQLPEYKMWWTDFGPRYVRDKRSNEFFHLLPALTWWELGILALPIALFRRRLGPGWRAQLTLFAWAAATLVVWCLLMFIPRSAVVHQGSYALPMALFAVLSAWFECAGAWVFLPILALQGATFFTVWEVAGAGISGTMSGTSAAAACVAAALIAAFVLREILVDRGRKLES
jgi:hypothetical protein